MSTYQHWPIEGQSYDIAATTVILATTTLTALAARLYVLLQHKGELPVLASAVSICSSHVLMLCQSACIVFSCYHGWGSSINDMGEDTVQIAETTFFVSNVLLIMVHGCARVSTAITLWRACRSTRSAKFAIAIFPTVTLWTIGSIVGLIAKRAIGVAFWLPVGVDCSSALWAGVSLSGLAVDVAMTACAFTFVASLQIGLAKKLYTLFVFGAGTLVVIPNAYGISYLDRNHQWIAQDPTLRSAPFILANQAAIAVSLWCRALETARKLQQDMGYASYGLPSFSVSDYFRGGSRARAYYGRGSKQNRTLRIPRASGDIQQSLSEDEVRLRPDGDQGSSLTRAGAEDTCARGKSVDGPGDIQVHREFGWSVDDVHSVRRPTS